MVQPLSKFLKPIMLKTAEGFSFFDYEEIVLFEASGNYSFLFTTDNHQHIKVLHNLGYIEKKYSNNGLFRCHKKYIINLKHINKFFVKTKSILMKNNMMIPVSEKCVTYFKSDTITKK